MHYLASDVILRSLRLGQAFLRLKASLQVLNELTMKWLLAVLPLVPLCASAGQFVLSGNLGFTNQAGWSPALNTRYCEAGACYAVLPTNGTFIQGTVSLGSLYPAGTYRLLVRLTTPGYSTESSVTATSGSASGTRVGVVNGSWANSLIVSPTESFSNVVLTFSKSSPSNLVQSYYVEGIYLTANTNEAVPDRTDLLANSAYGVFDYSVPATTNTAYVKGNYCLNSSFELGFEHGWKWSRTQTTDGQVWLEGGLDSTTAAEGKQSVKIGYPWARNTVYSPPIRLRGERAWRQYTLSFYAKGDGLSLDVSLVPTVPSAVGMATNAVRTFRFSTVTDWRRYSTSFWFAAYPSRDLSLTWSHTGAGTRWANIDAVQLEEGDLTDYAPRWPVEFALSVGRHGNLLNVGDSRTVQIRFVNASGRTLSRNFNYEVFDWMNRRIVTGAIEYSVPYGMSTNTLTLTTTNNGTSRMVAWLTENSGDREELVFSVVPLPISASLNTNSVIGTHANFQSSVAASNYLWGFVWNRSLSPGGFFRWGTIEPSAGTFDWSQSDAYVNAVTNYQIIYASLDEPGSDPDWALTNGFPRLDAHSNYVYAVVNRYKSRIHYWENLNEGNYSSVQRAELMTMEAGAVKAADPTAYFVAMALPSTSISAVDDIWALLSTNTRSQIDAIALHNYPSSKWMAPDTAGTYKAWAEWGRTNGKAVWFTEGGSYGAGNKLSDVVGYVTDVKYAYPHIFEDVFRRGVYQTTEKTLRLMCRTLGYGFGRCFYYDARLSAYNYQRPNTAPTLWNYDDSLRPDAAALLWLKYWIDPPVGAYAITSDANRYVEAYVWQKGNNTVLAVFNQDRTNRMITLTNGAFAVYDAMGNFLQTNVTTAMIGRTPRYWVSGALTTNQMIQSFQTGTITSAADTTPPAVSIDSSPQGAPTSYELPLRFRWTAIDDTYVNIDGSDNVVTRYRLPGVQDWSDWSTVRYTELASLPSVRTRLEVQAKDAAGNESETMQGPVFVVTPPDNLRPISAP